MPTVREIVEAFDRDNPDELTALRAQNRVLRAACEAAFSRMKCFGASFPHLWSMRDERAFQQLRTALDATKEQPK